MADEKDKGQGKTQEAKTQAAPKAEKPQAEAVDPKVKVKIDCHKFSADGEPIRFVRKKE